MEPTAATNRPRRATRAEVARTVAGDGATVYILHNPDADSYLQIDERNFFLWEQMDGEHDLGAIAVAYMRQFGALPLDRLDALIGQLTANALLEGADPVPRRAPPAEPASRMARVEATAFQREFDWEGADAFFGGLHRRVGRVFFTRPALIVLGLVAAIGFAGFLFLHRVQDYRLFKVEDSYGAAVVVMAIATVIVTFLHESGHALTCKAYGRRIRKAGMMFYYGRPAFFVDVSDMWMAPRHARILVSLAGPAVNFLVASLLTIAAFWLDPSTAAEVLFVAAFVAYLHGLVNLNPLLELDGYYILVDWLQIPGLRTKSFAFVKDDLPAKIRGRDRFTRQDLPYVVYGALAAAFTVLTVVLVVYFWQRELRFVVSALATGEDPLSAVLVGGLAFIASTWLIVGLIARLLGWLGARRRGGDERVEGGDTAH